MKRLFKKNIVFAALFVFISVTTLSFAFKNVYFENESNELLYLHIIFFVESLIFYVTSIILGLVYSFKEIKDFMIRYRAYKKSM